MSIYPPVGYCIYCGSTEEPLTDEHPMPFGMGGRMVLPRASCENCRSITQKIEDIVLRQILKGFRVQHRIQSRRKAPATLPLWLLSPDGNSESVPVAINEHPGTLTLPVFEPPGLLDGKPMERELKITLHMLIRNPDRLNNLFGNVTLDVERVTGRMAVKKEYRHEISP